MTLGTLALTLHPAASRAGQACKLPSARTLSTLFPPFACSWSDADPLSLHTRQSR